MAVSDLFSGPKWVAAPKTSLYLVPHLSPEALTAVQGPFKVSESFQGPLKAFQERFESLECGAHPVPIPINKTHKKLQYGSSGRNHEDRAKAWA